MCWLFGGEPTLDEMLVDPTVLAVMKRDGVDPDDLRKLLGEMSQRVRHELSSSAGPDGTDADPSRPAGASSRQARRRAWELHRGSSARALDQHRQARRTEPAFGADEASGRDGGATGES